MIRPLSLPMIIASGISLIFGIFFLLLHFRLRSRYKEKEKSYFIFSQLSFVSCLFLGSFSILINSGSNLDILNISNRITVIGGMFNILLALEFFVSFFHYREPIPLKWCYVVNILFIILCLFPNPYFLEKAFYSTSRFYTGLVFGPLFQLYGLWIIVLSVYSLAILSLVYIKQRKSFDSQSTVIVKILMFTTGIWLLSGIADVLTATQIIDIPPMTWVGTILIILSIAWILVLQIDKLYEERRLLSKRLMYDHLTEAFSRSFFEVRLAESIRLIKRDSLKGFYLCMFDIDDFKSVNDRYGHSNGDLVLKGIASIVRDSLRPSDCSARLGGDEFALLLIGAENDTQAVTVVERIRENISKTRFGEKPHEFQTSCSFGLVRVGKEHLLINDLTDQLLIYADKALYVSKHKGKNAVNVSLLPNSES